MSGNYEDKYGKMRLDVRLTALQASLPTTLFCLMGVVGAVVMLVFYDSWYLYEAFSSRWFIYILLIGSVLAMPITYKLVKPIRQATVYERGVVFVKGTHAVEVDFSDITKLEEENDDFVISSTKENIKLNKLILPVGLNKFKEELKKAYAEFSTEVQRKINCT